MKNILGVNIYPPSQKTASVSSRINAKNFLLRRDFAPNLPALLAQAWRAGEADGRRYPDRRIGELHHFIAVFLIGVHLFLLLQLIFFPYPELFIYSYLTKAGLLPYKQITDQHFPGLMFLPVNLYSMGITTLAGMRIIHLCIVFVTDIIFLRLSENIIKKRSIVLLSLAVYIFWQIYFEGYMVWIETFVTPILMLALLSIYRLVKEKTSLNLFNLSFLLGLSLIFKQTVLPVIFLVYVYLVFIKVRVKDLILSVVVMMLPFIFAAVYFYHMGVFNDFIYWTFTFNLTTFSMMGKTHPKFTDLIKLLPSLGAAMVTVFILLRKLKDKKYIPLFLFFFGTLFFAYARFDYIHLQPALPYSIIIIFLFAKSLPSKVLLLIGLLYTVISLYLFLPYYKFNYRPGESPMFNDQGTRLLLNRINKHYRKGDVIFTLGTYPHLYYLTETLPPGRVFTFQFPWFMKIDEKMVLQGIINDPPKLIIRDSNSQVGEYLLIKYMQNINEFVNKNYKVVDTVNNNEILVKI